MTAADARSRLRSHFSQLGQGRLIPVLRTLFWAVFWTAPALACDVYDAVAGADVHTVAVQNAANVLSLVRVLCTHLVRLPPAQQLERLNCIRLLTRVLPHVFEMPAYADIEQRLFWDSAYDPLHFVGATLREDPKDHSSVLAHDVVATLVQMVPLVWEPGVGCAAPFAEPSTETDCFRTEVLRLLLVLVLASFYQPPRCVVAQGLRFLLLLVLQPAPALQPLVCSLLNVVCRLARSDGAGLAHADAALVELRHVFVSCCAQLLACVAACPPTPAHPNHARAVLAALGDADARFAVAHLLGLVRDPRPLLWAVEAMALLWELLQCNRLLRAEGPRVAAKLMPLLLQHAAHELPRHQHGARLAAYFFFYLLAQPWARGADDVVVQLCAVLAPLAPVRSSPHRFVFAMLGAALYNLVPAPVGAAAAAALCKLVARLAAALLHCNADVLALVLRAMCAACLKFPGPLLAAVAENRAVFEHVAVALDAAAPQLCEVEDLEELLMPALPTGMSARAREKHPLDAPLRRTWGGSEALGALLALSAPDSEPQGAPRVPYDLRSDTPVHTMAFAWNEVSLGWYMLLVYLDVYHCTAHVKSHVGTSSTLINNLLLSFASLGKLVLWGLGDADERTARAVAHYQRHLCQHNVWAATSVRLFRPHEPRPPPLALVRRLSDFRMRSEEPQKRNSVLLHSFNSLNRSRSATPRSSIHSQ